MNRILPLFLLPIVLLLPLLLLLLLVGAAFSEPDLNPELPPDGWRVLTIRNEAECRAGRIGGETMQHMHGMARSPSDPDLIYLSHDCGQFWKSLDNGKTWRKTLGAGCPVIAGQSIEVDPVRPEVVFAIVDNAWDYLVEKHKGLYRSTDGAESWEPVLLTPGISQRIYQKNIACDPTSVGREGARRWYAGFPKNGLYRSEDAGDTWEQVADLSSHETLYAVLPHPKDGLSLYLATARGLFVSRDRGGGLRPLGDLPPGHVSAVAVDPKNADVLHAVVAGKGLYRSKNGGKNFELRKEFNAQWFFQNPGHPEVMYLVGAKAETLVTSDGGRTWTPSTVVRPLGLLGTWGTRFGGRLSAISPDPRRAGGAFGYAQARFFRTKDGGRTWHDSSTLFTGFAWGWGMGGAAFDRRDPRRFALFCYDVGMITTKNGGDWFVDHGIPWEWYQRRRVDWTGMYVGDFQPKEGSETIVASVGRYHKTKLVRTTDGGENWTLVDDETAANLFVAFHPKEPDLVFAGAKRSTDAGETWEPLPGLIEHRAEVLGMCASRPDTLYAMNRDRNTILRSDDRGETWRVYVRAEWHLNGLDSKPTFAVDPWDPDRVYTLSADRDLACFDGETWQTLGVLDLTGREGRNYVLRVSFDPRRKGMMYAGTHTAGLPFLFRSLDGGRTWRDVSQNLARLGCRGLEVHPHTGDVLTGGCSGTWVLPPPYRSPDSLYEKLARNKPGD